MEDSLFREGDVVAGKYQVERVLGEGGMGVVIAARHLELDQRVAVKFLLPEIAKRSDAAERFRREARAAVKIRSEHVARVIDVGTSDDGVPFMVMEYLEGADLGQELKRHGALPVVDAVTYLLEACEAVAEAHSAGIVHRDLKPANLFLASRADGSRLIKVLDFGISKSVSGGSMSDLSLTNTSALIGSPLYMSPEQMHSAKSVDARTDIWALGAILYQSLANRTPYVGESIPQLCSSLLNDTPPALATFRSDVPAELEVVVSKALQKNREHRFQTVAELARALVPFAPSARVHAERAARVLGATDVESRAPFLPSNTDPGASIDVSLGEQATISTNPPAKPGDRTLASWGKTGDTTGAGARHGGGKRGLTVAAIVAGLIAATAIWLAMRAPAQAAQAAAGRPSAEADPVPVQGGAPPPATAPVEQTAPAPSAEPTPDAAVAPEATPAAKRMPTRNEPPRRNPASTPSPKSTVPDFGGRR